MFNQLEKSILLKSDRYEKMRVFWENELSGFTRSESKAKRGTTGKPVVLHLSIPDELCRLLHEFGKSDPFLIYTLLLSGLQITTGFYRGLEQMASMSPPLERLRTEATFGNLVPLLTHADDKASFAELVKRMRAKLLECYKHQDYPAQEIKNDELQNLMDVNEIDFAASFRGLHSDLDDLRQYQGFPHFLFFEAGSGKIEYEVRYDEQFCESFVMGSFLDCWTYSLEQMLLSPHSPIQDIEFIRPRVKQVLAAQSAVDYRRTPALDSDLVSLLKKSVHLYPDRRAVWSEQGELSYRQLDYSSDLIAYQLIKSGAAKGDIIGIGVDRSEQTIAGIYGILKAGCAYVPLDSQWPEERVKNILSDAGVFQILVTGPKVQGTNGISITKISEISSDLESIPLPEIHSQDLAYVLYTSGSTGKPKGVMIEHGNVINLIEGLTAQGLYNNPGEHVACVAPFYFDASVKQIFTSLISGSSLYIVPEHTRLDGEALLEFYLRQRINISDGTPMHLQMLAVACNHHKGELPELHCMMIGGEALPSNIVREFTEAFQSGGPRIVNVYGPTECCVDTTAYSIWTDELGKLPPVVPIGRPLLNQSVYILDKHLKLRPEGAPGDLYIAGLNVGKGYLNRPELTEERFIRHPDFEGSLLYKTGDIARWLPGGLVEYLGRADFQIKHNGFRIEPGDIEQSALSYGKVTAALAKLASVAEGRQILTLYYSSNEDISHQDFKAYLASRLPSYMIPNAMMRLDHFPLTANGKIAGDLLPKPQLTADTDRANDRPKSRLELEIAEVWTAVLGVEPSSVNHSFFEAGGDSLKALQLKMELEKRQIELKLHDIFQYQTIRALSSKWSSLKTDTGGTIRKSHADLNEVFERFRVRPEEYSVLIGNEYKKIWVWNEENNESREALLVHLRHNFNKEVLPHYNEMSWNEDQWINRITCDEPKEEANQIADRLLEGNVDLSREITGNKTMESFAVSPIQRAFLELSSSHSGIVLTLDTVLDASVIGEEIKQLIREQAMLRSSLEMDGESFEWNEHEPSSHTRIPFEDLRKYSPVEQRLILQELNDRLFYDTYVLHRRLLYRMAVVRMNERDYRVLLACHHAVYDGMSGEYIQKLLTERVEAREAGRFYPVEYAPHYREYVEQIQKGLAVEEQIVINDFSLKSYDQASRKIQALMDSRSDGRLRNICIEVPLEPHHKERSSEYFFEASIRLIQQLSRQWLGAEELHIPLLLFHYGRRYEQQSFYNTVGVFIDVLPFVLQEEREAYGVEIGILLKKLSENNINFTSFLYDHNAKRKNNKIADLIDPSSHSGIWFNYHGKVERFRLDGINALKKPAMPETENNHANQIFGLPTLSFDVTYTDEVYRLSVTGPFDMYADDIIMEIQKLIYPNQYISAGAI